MRADAKSGKNQEMHATRLTGRLGNELSSPYWSARLGVLRFVDREGGDLFTLDRRGGVQRRWSGAATVAVMRPRAEGGVLVVTDRSLSLASRDDLGDLQSWGALLADSRQRFVTGSCSPTGRLYLGTVAYGRTPGIAMVYRLDAGEATGRPVVTGLTSVGGVAWSPDHSMCYLLDDGVVYGFDYHPHHSISDQRELFPSMFGDADGLQVDAEGGLWLCHTEAGLLVRHTVQGDVTVLVDLPGVTACAFGGPNLTTLYCLADGAVWSLEPGVAGLPVLPFRGEFPRHYA